MTYLSTQFVDGGDRDCPLLPYMYSNHQNLSILGQGEKSMEKKRCNSCGSTENKQRRTDYLYSYKGNYLLVPNTPVEICQNCGMVYYDAGVLKEIENHFFAIQRKNEVPDHYLEIPQWAYS
jgi:YgiT-type zinc finger domain-containing protein